MKYTVYRCKNCGAELVKGRDASRYNTLIAVGAVVLYYKAKQAPDLSLPLFLIALFSAIAIFSLLLATNAIEVAKRGSDEEC